MLFCPFGGPGFGAPQELVLPQHARGNISKRPRRCLWLWASGWTTQTFAKALGLLKSNLNVSRVFTFGAPQAALGTRPCLSCAPQLEGAASAPYVPPRVDRSLAEPCGLAEPSSWLAGGVSRIGIALVDKAPRHLSGLLSCGACRTPDRNDGSVPMLCLLGHPEPTHHDVTVISLHEVRRVCTVCDLLPGNMRL